MDFQSVNSYVGCQVKLTLSNSFWYRCKIISVNESSVVFIEERGRKLTVHPSAIMIIEPRGEHE